MFDKLIKRKSKNQEDDFFKEEKKSETSLVEEEEEVTKEQLAEDLEAFKDDLKKGKSKPLIDAEPIETESEGEELDIEEEQEEKSTKTKTLEIKSEDTETEWSMKKKSNNNNNDDDGWLNKDYEEGELAVDVYQDKDNVYVRSTIAGVSSDDIDISIHNDLLTIRGKREKTKDMQGVDYFYQECYWGSFSRSIILPVEVKADKIDAFLKDGILTIVLPKAKNASTPKIKVKEK